MAHVLTLVSAGATLAGKRGLFPAHDPLTASSLAKAKNLMLDTRSCEIWNGPDRASRETAEAMGLLSVTEHLLSDVDYGQWAGRTISDVADQEPERFQQWIAGAPPPDGCGVQDMSIRIHRWLFGHLHRRGRSIAIVSPNVARACLLTVLGVPLNELFRLDVRPLTVSTMTSNGQSWRVRSIGISPCRR